MKYEEEKAKKKLDKATRVFLIRSNAANGVAGVETEVKGGVLRSRWGVVHLRDPYFTIWTRGGWQVRGGL